MLHCVFLAPTTAALSALHKNELSTGRKQRCEMDGMALFGASFRDRDANENFLAVGCPVDDYVIRRLCHQQNKSKHKLLSGAIGHARNDTNRTKHFFIYWFLARARCRQTDQHKSKKASEEINLRSLFFKSIFKNQIGVCV